MADGDVGSNQTLVHCHCFMKVGFHEYTLVFMKVFLCTFIELNFAS